VAAVVVAEEEVEVVLDNMVLRDLHKATAVVVTEVILLDLLAKETLWGNNSNKVSCLNLKTHIKTIMEVKDSQDSVLEMELSQ